MKSTKKFVLFILPFFIAAFAEAQTVKVQKEQARIKGENLDGFEVELEGTATAVSLSLNKYLKTKGKTRLNDNVITVTEPTLNGTTYSLPVFALTNEKSKNTSAWIGIKVSDWPEEDAKKVSKELEKIIYEFGLKFYRDQIQLQIDESTRASLAVDKHKQRLTNENRTLNTRLEDNKREKIQLEKSIQTNQLENETLLKKIEKNKHDQDSIALAGEQIKKVVEMHKERQRKVN